MIVYLINEEFWIEMSSNSFSYNNYRLNPLVFGPSCPAKPSPGCRPPAPTTTTTTAAGQSWANHGFRLPRRRGRSCKNPPLLIREINHFLLCIDYCIYI